MGLFMTRVPETERGSALCVRWETVEVGRDCPFPSGRREDTAISYCALTAKYAAASW